MAFINQSEMWFDFDCNQSARLIEQCNRSIYHSNYLIKQATNLNPLCKSWANMNFFGSEKKKNGTDVADALAGGQCATRISSLTFQRWTTCVTSLCLSWVSMGLVQWLSSTPQSMQVVQVSTPPAPFLLKLHFDWISFEMQISHMTYLVTCTFRMQIGIPLLILPLLSAAYAEVNVEGKRLLKVIDIHCHYYY